MLNQFGQYFLDEPLATGGMARLYRAHLRGLGGFTKPLVVKQVLPELARDPRFVEMFVREANTLVRMNHPHIVSVYELGVVDGIYFLAMEYVEGATIAAILRDGPLPAPLVAQLAVQVCDALEYAHGRFGILHRDLTPRNIIVDGAGHARLLDFGVSTHIDSTDRTGFGSPGYMAPEQVRGEPCSVRSDVFSFGTVLYEALEGQPAFLREDRATTKRALLDEPPPRLDGACHPSAMVRLLERMLAPAPEQRPASAQAVGRELRGWLSQHAPEGAYDGLVERVAHARARRPAPALLTTTPLPVGATVPVDARTLATSPLLDEARRRSGPKPIPVPVGVTRPITGRKPVPTSLEPDAPDVQISPDDPNEIGSASSPASAASPPRRTWMWAVFVAVAAIGLALLVPRELVNAPATRTEQPAVEERAAPDVAFVPPPVAEPVAEAAEPAPIAPVPPASEAPSTGRLVVNAVPWAEIRLDGRVAGTTPLRGLSLRAGKHTLSVYCPPLDRRVSVPVVIRTGETTRVAIDLQRQPPDVQVH